MRNVGLIPRAFFYQIRQLPLTDPTPLPETIRLTPQNDEAPAQPRLKKSYKYAGENTTNPARL